MFPTIVPTIDLTINIMNLKSTIGEIKINESLFRKYYECDFQYYDLHIKNILSAKSKIIISPLSFCYDLKIVSTM